MSVVTVSVLPIRIWIEIFTFVGGGVKLLASVDITTRAPWITQNEQHFVAG
jgi:hypothetical protein